MGSSGRYADSFSSMSSMDEYSTRDLDFSDLALEDSATDISAESAKEGLSGAYAKANYEVCSATGHACICRGRIHVWRQCRPHACTQIMP